MTGFDRDQALARLAEERFDVLVVGGGITGAGVALDAASRGLRTALVDKGDFGSGTSSKSSKLVHGGLRYLRQREFGLVRESLVERQLLLENAPHLVRPLEFLIPLFGHHGVTTRTVASSYSTALWLYDLSGAWRIGSRHRRIAPDEALVHVPRLRADDLVSALTYVDAQADDARLTLAVLRTAVLDYSAVAANYARVSEFLVDPSGTVTGARVAPAVMPGGGGGLGDTAEGPDIDVRATVVVNATGVWSDDVRALAEGRHPRSLRPAKGVHITVRSSAMPCDAAAVLPVRGDRRTIFVVPWPGTERTYVGTTDTAYDGPLDAPSCTDEDVDYLLDAVNASTTASLGRADVVGVWAGLRPLLEPAPGHKVSDRTADLSRRHSVRTARDGVVTVTGGKLTTYRKMAEDTMRHVSAGLRARGAATPSRSSRTRHLRLHGAPAGDGSGGHLEHRYGAEAAAVRALARGRPELLEPVVEGLPYLGAEVVFAVREEMARTIDDVLARRTRAVLEDARAAAAAAPGVAALVADELGWTEERTARHVDAFVASVRAELRAAGVPDALGDPR